MFFFNERYIHLYGGYVKKDKPVNTDCCIIKCTYSVKDLIICQTLKWIIILHLIVLYLLTIVVCLLQGFHSI